jgi:outer membrane beta-barrel protein
MLKTTLLTIILSASGAWAQQTPAPTPAAPAADSRGSDKLDIKKLEQKYWAAKDDDFSVVQNRRYTKAERFYFNLGGGIPFNDPFATGSILSGTAGYYFNERWGVDFTYSKANFKDNEAVDQFISRYGITPDRNYFDGSQMLSVSYVPLYAKMSFVDRAIIYFDMGISVGAGNVDYVIKKQEGDETMHAFAYQWSVFQQIFFSEHFAVRVDLINKYTTEQTYTWSTNPTSTQRDLGKKSVNDSSFMLGLTYWH